VAVWVNPGAQDEQLVYANNRLAGRTALANGAASLPSVEQVIAARSAVSNPFFTP
jgi:5,6,7,8-tetrahydromethanopterin hydro-lyase